MRGGKTIWFIDQVAASMDSLASTSNTMAVHGNLNLDDQLFRYGCRVNGNLILDLQAAYIPINTAPPGNPPKWDYFPWVYFPLIMPTVKHPIVNNLNAVKGEFVSSIDTVAADAVTKTFLLISSRYSKVVNAPVNINLQSIALRPDEKQFNRPGQPLSLLLEGVFHSNFKNRIPPEIAYNTKIGFRETGENNKMIVVADGDIIRNQVQKSTGRAYPLGFDKYTGQEFGNKDFVMNCFDYLCDDSNLIGVRSRELKLRLLDKTEITTHRFGWQLANTCLPVAIIILIGLVKAAIRKRKYGAD